ncbi:hypothetical protein FHX42_002869 [Saccharopolyspora lacisalsi]|uniref:Uncharacterized protein n=1 Tax=Halosaccharopolyspora lacisalsi TaxID=1000566 RepID=A0A839E3L8_9PSEU|nr:hypothetical protein [Halosaccharopolyspora lacisalsi]MBA8825518.1 hypothetical protein [Halosaccharopolyspora lacisalsi]
MTGQERSPEAEFLARLDGLTTDISGTARVSLAEMPGRMSLSRYRELAATRGGTVEGISRSGGSLHFQVKRARTSATTQRLGPEFLSGPSLTELRDSPPAREEAARVLRETSVDVLSDAVLDAVRGRHLAWRRKVVRFGWLSALPAVFAFTGFLAPDLWRDGHTGAGNVLAIASLVSVVLFAVLLPLPIRFEKSRKAAIGDYKSAYERVVSAALVPSGRSRE